jgi:hypothetical protein
MTPIKLVLKYINGIYDYLLFEFISLDNKPKPTNANADEGGSKIGGIIAGVVVAIIVCSLLAFCFLYKNPEGTRLIVALKNKCFESRNRRKNLETKKTVGGMEMEKANVLYQDYYKKVIFIFTIELIYY